MRRKSGLYFAFCSIFVLVLSIEKASSSDDLVVEDELVPVKKTVRFEEDFSDSDVEEEVNPSKKKGVLILKRSIQEPILLETSYDKTGRHILCLDGGGQRGVMQIYFMALMEARTGKAIWEQFDLISGTSAGGMAGLLAVLPHPEDSSRAKYSMAQALDIMTGLESRSIFKKVETYGWSTPFKSKFWSSFGRNSLCLWGMTMPRYSRSNLESFLLKHFGDARLSEALTNVMVSAYRLPGSSNGEGTPYFFKSLKSKTRDLSHDRLMREVAGATSAAPTFFDPGRVHRLNKYGEITEKFEDYVDGGVFANNPSVPGAAELLIEYMDAVEKDPLCMSIEEARFSIISLGTGRKIHKGVSADHYYGRGVAFWIKTLLSDIMIVNAS